MRLLHLVLVFGIACTLDVSARAGALDSPGEKKVTVKSEIQRGYSAILNVESVEAGPQAFEDAVRAVEDKNEQQRTDSDGFKLGVEFAAWQFYWKLLSSGFASVPIGGGERMDAAHVTASMADLRFGAFRGVAKRLGVTADDLTELFHGYNPALDNPAWESAVKGKNFKGTKPIQ